MEGRPQHTGQQFAEPRYVRNSMRAVLWGARVFGWSTLLYNTCSFGYEAVTHHPIESFRSTLPLYWPVIIVVVFFFGFLRIKGHMSSEEHLLTEPIHLPVVAAALFLLPTYYFEAAMALPTPDFTHAFGNFNRDSFASPVHEVIQDIAASSTATIEDHVHVSQLILFAHATYLSLVFALLGFVRIAPAEVLSNLRRTIENLYENIMSLVHDVFRLINSATIVFRFIVVKTLDPLTAISVFVVRLVIGYRMIHPKTRQRWRDRVEPLVEELTELWKAVARRDGFVIWQLDQRSAAHTLLFCWFEDMLGGLSMPANEGILSGLSFEKHIFRVKENKGAVLIVVHAQIFDNLFNALVDLV